MQTGTNIATISPGKGGMVPELMMNELRESGVNRIP